MQAPEESERDEHKIDHIGKELKVQVPEAHRQDHHGHMGREYLPQSLADDINRL